MFCNIYFVHADKSNGTNLLNVNFIWSVAVCLLQKGIFITVFVLLKKACRRWRSNFSSYPSGMFAAFKSSDCDWE